MPTLEDLFNSGTLQRGPYAGQTPKDAFAPRNSNKIELSSNSPVINATTMKLVNKLRASNGSTLEETVLEQEVTGVRILGTLSQPLLYGPELGRMVLGETLPLSEMKADTTGLLPSGPIGKAFNSVRTATTKVLGIPTLATPTFTKNFSDPTKGGSLGGINSIQSNYPKLLQDIKDSADGSLLGKLLKGGVGSLTDPNQLGAKVIGEALKLGKGLLRDKLIGGGQKPAADYNFDDYPAFANGVKIVRNYGRGTNTTIDGSFASTSISATSGNYFNALGARYSSFFLPTLEVEEFPPFDDALGSEGPPIIIQTFKPANEVEENREFGILKSTPFPDVQLENDKKVRNPKLKWRSSEKTKKKNSIEQGIAGNYSSYTNIINRQVPYTIGDAQELANKLEIDSKDIITLKFESIKQNKAVNFLSTITGLSESFSPSWNSNKFIGNPFNFYTYDGIERTVSFSFKIFSLNAIEHKAAWDRINFLTSLVYPQSFEGDAGYIAAPFLRLTIGDMYKRKEGFLESLSYSFDDNSPWETEIERNLIDSDTPEKMDGYKLPKIINVETTFKFIEQRNGVSGHRYYPFVPITATT